MGFFVLMLLLLNINLLHSNTTELSNLRQEKPMIVFNYVSPDPNDYLYASVLDCNDKDCPFPNKCSWDRKQCFCQKGYANYPLMTKEKQYCQYKQSPQLLSFLLELVLNMGIGHMFAGRTEIGIIKLLFYLVPFFCCSLFLKKEGTAYVCWGCCHCCFVIVWWIIDAINFGLNFYRDGNGVPLEKW